MYSYERKFSEARVGRKFRNILNAVENFVSRNLPGVQRIPINGHVQL